MFLALSKVRTVMTGGPQKPEADLVHAEPDKPPSNADVPTPHELAQGKLGGRGVDIQRSTSTKPVAEQNHPIARDSSLKSVRPKSRAEERPGALAEQNYPIARGSSLKSVRPKSRAEERPSAREEQVKREGKLKGGRRNVAKNETSDTEAMRIEISRLRDQIQAYEAQSPALPERAGHGDILGQTFGVIANLTSIGDVRRMMDDLNDEIFQMAATVSEVDVRARLQKSSSRRWDPDMQYRMIHILGDELTRLLMIGRSHPPPDIVVQHALQTAMAGWGVKLHLYADIRDSEGPTDAARWRAITRKQLLKRGLSSDDARHSLLDCIADVLDLAILRGEGRVSRRAVEEMLAARITAVARLVIDLNRAIGIHMISEDLETGIIPPGVTFDPTTMEDTWADGSRGVSRREIVACTTGLGVQERGHDGENAVIMKPKVVLRSTLEELME
ncbi:hypothetical protein GGX14DRAFT_609822 [Mycena pura]|uniref:Uncharacterized protein n=1 Tax=Mycena pura TaxID=153505 RepID=A0AAD6VL75_9AGAR|nr:hypothetical protein GGX14DRAFT_609822 [Mycena pura]